MRLSSNADNFVEKVQDYILRHLDAPHRLSDLGSMVGVSTFHLHRKFREVVGQTPSQQVRRLRLKRASARLAFESWRSITDIALEAGYSNPESFTRSFGRLMRQSPSAFREKPDWHWWRAVFKVSGNAGTVMPVVQIVDLAQTLVAAVEHRGASEDVYESTRKLIEWRRLHRVAANSHRTFCVVHDIRAEAARDYRVDVCVEFAREVRANAQGVISKVIPGGRCARVRYVGPREYIPVLHPLYAEWLPESGERLRESPLILHFVNVGAGIPDHEMITDVYLPIQ